MAGDPEVQRKFIDNPKGKALQVDRVKGGKAVVNAASDDPAVRFGVANDDIFATGDLDQLVAIARESETFREMLRQLKKRPVTVTHVVERLSPDTGGGRTFGKPESPARRIAIWPDVIPKGFHVLDVFIHEYGHVFEDNGGPGYQEFVNQVQDDLGIRRTPDSHLLGKPQPATPLPVPGP